MKRWQALFWNEIIKVLPLVVTKDSIKKLTLLLLEALLQLYVEEQVLGCFDYKLLGLS
jgi:hypothetical protein